MYFLFHFLASGKKDKKNGEQSFKDEIRIWSK